MSIFEKLKVNTKQRVALVGAALDVFGTFKNESNKDVNVSDPNKKKVDFSYGQEVNIMRTDGNIERWRVSRQLPENKFIVVEPQKKLEKVVSLSELEGLNPKFETKMVVNIQRSEKSGGGIEKDWEVVCQFPDGIVLVRKPGSDVIKRITPLKLKELNP